MEKAVAGTLAVGFGKVCQTTHGLPHMIGFPVAQGLMSSDWAPTFNRISQFGGNSIAGKSHLCGNIQQHPALASLLSQAGGPGASTISRIVESGKSAGTASQNDYSLDVAQAKENLNDESVRSASSTTFQERIHNPLHRHSMADLVQADWQNRLMRLEQSCYDFSAENRSLQEDLQAVNKSHRDAKELNLRLSKEVQRARREESGAVSKVKWLEEEIQRMQHKCQSLSRELRTARRKSTQQSSVVDNDANSRYATVNTGDVDLQFFDLPPQDKEDVLGGSTEPDASTAEVEFTSSSSTDDGLEGQAEDRGIVDTGICRCSNTVEEETGDMSWGCSRHQVYPMPLLLAHRAMSLSIARGAPGLEPMYDTGSFSYNGPVARSWL